MRVRNIMGAVVAIGLVAPAPAIAASDDGRARSAAGGRVSLTTTKAPVPQGQRVMIVARSTSGRMCRLRTVSPRGRRHVLAVTLAAPANRLAFDVSPDARRGRWLVALSCGRKTGRAYLRVKGGSGGRHAPLLVATSISVSALDHDRLDQSVIPGELEKIEGKDTGGPDPDFRLPFPCGEEWAASTYAGHGHASDWNAPSGDHGRSVVASAEGVAHPQPFGQYNGGFGNYIVVVHGGGWTTLYAHLSAYTVSPGQAVSRGQEIGKVGNTGKSYGAHLHFEQRLGGIRQAQRFSFGPLSFTTYKSDNCAPPPAAEEKPPEEAPSEVRKVITVDNRVTNGGGMREDPAGPARLTTQTWTYCGRRGCNINGTERSSGQAYDAAVCQTHGERTTNGNDRDPADDSNPERYESTLYYGVRLTDETFGYVSEVWIRAADRGGLGLPACPR